MLELVYSLWRGGCGNGRRARGREFCSRCSACSAVCSRPPPPICHRPRFLTHKTEDHEMKGTTIKDQQNDDREIRKAQENIKHDPNNTQQHRLVHVSTSIKRD